MSTHRSSLRHFNGGSRNWAQGSRSIVGWRGYIEREKGVLGFYFVKLVVFSLHGVSLDHLRAVWVAARRKV